MTCDDTLNALRKGEPLSSLAQAHAGNCELCQEMTRGGVEAARALDVDDAPDTERILALTHGDLASEQGLRGSLRSLPTRLRVTIAFSALCVVTLAVGVLGARPDMAAYPIGRLVFAIACLLVAAFTATSFALRPPFRPRTGAWKGGVAFALGVPLLLAALPEAHSAMAVSLEGRGEDFFPRALGCFTFGAALSLPVLALILAMSRVSWSRKVLLAAAAAGVGGVAALEMHCPLTSQAHILFGHASVAVALTIAAAAVWTMRRR